MMFSVEHERRQREEVNSCTCVPPFADCQKLLSQLSASLNFEGDKSSVVSNSLAIAIQILKKHKGFIPSSESNNNADFDSGKEEEDVEKISYTHSKPTAPLSAEENSINDLLHGIVTRISRTLLSFDLRPISPIAAPTFFGSKNMSSSTSSLIAFENYCALAGCDAACAALRDQRASWLHAEIGGTLTPQSSRSPKIASAHTTASVVIESPDSIVSLVDRITMQCDADFSFVVQIAGLGRWRQFADLYQTAAIDSAARIKQQAVGYLEATPNPSISDLSHWLLACLRAEQLRCREFLHQAGQGITIRPKSGSVLKANVRSYNGENEHASHLAATNNDLMLVKLFGDAIALAFAKDCHEVKFDSAVDVGDVFPVISQPDAERWPRRVSKYCCLCWDVFGTFIHIFYIETPRWSQVADQQPTLETVISAIRSFVDRHCRDFATFLGSGFAKHESFAYLVIADLQYLERQLNSLKLVLAATSTNTSTQRVISELREFIRGQLDAMHARIIAINARLLLESLLHDWRQLPSLDGNNKEGTPAAALVAWALHLNLWYKHFNVYLSPASISHTFLSVALASFERITARLISNSTTRKQDVNVALRLAVNIFFIAVRSPELIGSNFLSTFSVVGTGSADSPTELRDLIASFNSLGNTLVEFQHRMDGVKFQPTSPVDWVVTSLGLPLTTTDEDSFLLFALLIIACHPSSCHSLTVRIICSPKLLHRLTELLTAEPEATENMSVLFQFLKAVSSTVEPNLMGCAILSVMTSTSNDQHAFASHICSFLTDNIIASNQCLELILTKCRLYFETSTRLQLLPCGCSLSDVSTSTLGFIESLPSVFESLDLPTKLAVGAYDYAVNSGGLSELVGAIIRKIGKEIGSATSNAAFTSSLLEIADYLATCNFDEVETLSLSSSGRIRRRRRQQSPRPKSERRDDLDERLYPVLKNLRQITTEKFLVAMKSSIVGDAQTDDSLAEQYRHMVSSAESVLNDAAGNELLASICSFPQGLDHLLRMQNIIYSHMHKLLPKAPTNGRSMEILEVARIVSPGDTFSLVNCVISTAKNCGRST